MTGGFVLLLLASFLQWPRVALFGFLGWAIGYGTLIVHLNITKALTPDEKTAWRRQLWAWPSTGAWVAIPLYLFARDLGWHARGFTRRGDPKNAHLPTSGVEEIYNYRDVDASLATSGQPTEEQLLYVARDGFQVVINLALHGDPRYSLKDEAVSVTSLGMEYVHIPVDFQSPTESDLQKFFDALDVHRHQKLLVHCAANKRVTAFVGLYRTIKLDWPIDKAFALMHSVWEPDPVWAAFISERIKKDFS
jgi:protein tyrosine phosphatase (PTP) superfamily phosphohydrolase (DUF442 family)